MNKALNMTVLPNPANPHNPASRTQGVPMYHSMNSDTPQTPAMIEMMAWTWLRTAMSQRLGMAPTRLSPTVRFLELGLEWAQITYLIAAFSEYTGQPLAPTAETSYQSRWGTRLANQNRQEDLKINTTVQ